MPQTSSSLIPNHKHINLYYLNQLYSQSADLVAKCIWDQFNLRLAVTSGIWGGTYLITDKQGKCLNRVHRLYCIINFPQNSILEEARNSQWLIEVYSKTLIEAFKPHGIHFKLEGWDETMLYSNKEKPSKIMHFSDSSGHVMWLRAFFVWNQATWEESIVYDTIRNIKVLKESLDINSRPLKKKSDELKFLLQDMVITYRTLENALHPDFVEHAEPIINSLTEHFLAGLHDPRLIWELYLEVYNNALVYGLEEALESYYSRANLDIHKVEVWPADKINYVPDELKEKLVPVIKNLFNGFKDNLEQKSAGSILI